MKKSPPSCLKTILLAVFAAMASACAPDQRVRHVEEYYPDGSLQMVKSLKGDRLHGRTRAYFPGGRLKSDSRWVEGKRTGVTVLYYPNGARMDSSNFVHDSLDGAYFSFYRNGTVKQKASFTQGLPTGVRLFFDSTSKLVERQVHGPSGRLIYACNYDKHGKAYGHVLYPITEAPDTIAWGEAYAGCVRFGYPLKGHATMIVGLLGEDLQALDRWPIVDTFQVVPQGQDGRFYFSYYPKRPGKNSFQFKFIQPESPWNATVEDSLSVDQQSVTKPFFVKKPGN